MNERNQGKEFPGGRTLWEWVGEAEERRPEADGETRRDVLKWMGFGVGTAGVMAAAGCSIPERRALPLVSQPEELIPGLSRWYATSCGGCAAACGLLVKVRDGRPIKIEGNPDSPISRGGTCATGQATVLSLYDSARFAGPRWHGRGITWEELDAEIVQRLEETAQTGRSIVLLSGPGTGPTFRRLLGDWRKRYPSARHVVHEALPLSALRLACERSFGRAVVPRLRFEGARLLVGIEADFLGTWLSPVELTRGYAEARRPHRGGSGAKGMLRHVQIESQMSVTGSNADQRIALRPSELPWAVLTLLAELARLAGEPTPPTPQAAGWDTWERRPALLPLAAELWAQRGASLVVCGENDPELQTVVQQINALLGNVGMTLDVDAPSFQSEGSEAEVAELVAEMERGEVGALLLLGVNPVYDHPEGDRFARAMARVPLVVSFADRPDETSEQAHAIVPDVHFLEAWDDVEPVAGLLQLRQPAIVPLFDARPAAESLLRWMGREERWFDLLRQRWREEVLPKAPKVAGFDLLWDGALERGTLELAGGSEPKRSARGPLAAAAWANAAAALADRAPRPLGDADLELRLYAGVALRDGRWANNPWLQELPDPLTKMTWGNWVAIPPALAARRGLSDGDLVRLSRGKESIELPAVVQPGLADGTVAVALGYGRTRSGKVAQGVGRNVFPWRSVVAGFARDSAFGFSLAATGTQVALPRTQQHFDMEGRPIVREVHFAELSAGGGEGRRAGEVATAEAQADLWPEHEKPEHDWGMSIDLSACTGCSACVVACQAENNVAVVGRDEVARGREMHWIRIDRYYEGPAAAPRSLHQPMMCQHCDHAPCETVCPVLATVHSSDGLNQQVYNRCIGTRYCANNCPYKVRRFNWFHYAENERFDYTMNGELPRMVLNPDVGIRSRGVMEKCSMCIQRIQEGKLAAKQAGAPLADGAIRTACQQACPADAIVFGDRKNPASALARDEGDPRFYRVLEELGTRPGVGYLAKVRQDGGAVRPTPNQET